MTSKERAELKSKANSLEPVFQIGKGGMSDAVIQAAEDAFRTREIIKVKVLLDSAPEGPKELAQQLAEGTKSEVVQVIGGVIILYRENKELDAPKKKVKPVKKGKPLSKVKAKKARELKREQEQKKLYGRDKPWQKKRG